MVTANAGSVRQLSCVSSQPFKAVDALDLALAAPQMASFQVVVQTDVAEATRMLRNEEPFGAFRLSGLYIARAGRRGAPILHAADIIVAEGLALCAALSAHATPMRLLEILGYTPLHSPVVCDALCAAALACSLRELRLDDCSLSPTATPALARLIRGGVLSSLDISNGGHPMLDDATGLQLADAVAASRTLKRLELTGVGLWDAAVASAALMRAVTGHPSCDVYTSAVTIRPTRPRPAPRWVHWLLPTRRRWSRCTLVACSCATPACARCLTRCPITPT